MLVTHSLTHCQVSPSQYPFLGVPSLLGSLFPSYFYTLFLAMSFTTMTSILICPTSHQYLLFMSLLNYQSPARYILELPATY